AAAQPAGGAGRWLPGGPLLHRLGRRRRGASRSRGDARALLRRLSAVFLQQRIHREAAEAVVDHDAVAQQAAFAAEAEAPGQAYGGDVLRLDQRLDAMGIQRLEAVAEEGGHRLRHEALPPAERRQDVADFEAAVARLAVVVVDEADAVVAVAG